MFQVNDIVKFKLESSLTFYKGRYLKGVIIAIFNVLDDDYPIKVKSEFNHRYTFCPEGYSYIKRHVMYASKNYKITKLVDTKYNNLIKKYWRK
jgi:hypothetical protein